MRPETEADLAGIIEQSSEPVRIIGGGTRRVHQGGEPLVQTAGLSGVTLYEPGALTLVAQAGTPLSEVDALLQSENQRLAFEPMDHRGLLGTTGTPTLGGVVAGNVSGPRRIQTGACRDHLLGVRFVDGAGRIVKNGGRVMKNVTGYDLVKLMAGSWGTLGVLTEVSLKVLPRPETSACVMIDNLTVAQAVQAMSQALGSPFELTGAAHVPVGLDGHPVTMLRVEGFAGSVDYRVGQLQAMFGAHATRLERDPEAVATGWRWIRDVAAMRDTPGDVWRISCKPSQAPDLVDRLTAEEVLLDWGGGLIWARVPSGRDLRAKLGQYDGHATCIRGGGAFPMFQPQPPALQAIEAGLRAQFDPRGLLNRGLMAA